MEPEPSVAIGKLNKKKNKNRDSPSKKINENRGALSKMTEKI